MYLQIHATVTQLLESTLQAEQNLPLAWYDTLTHLSQATEYGLRLQELADLIKLSQSGLTRLLDRMAEEELILRRPCAGDRRGIYAVITPAGRARLAAAEPVYMRVLDEHFLQFLSCDEAKALERVFSHIVRRESEQVEQP